MQRSYVIVLAVCGAIFLFAVGFYLTGDGQGERLAPPTADPPAESRPTSTAPDGEAAPAPAPTGAAPRRSLARSDGESGGALDRLKATVDRARRAPRAADEQDAPRDEATPSATTSAAEESPDELADATTGEPTGQEPAVVEPAKTPVEPIELADDSPDARRQPSPENLRSGDASWSGEPAPRRAARSGDEGGVEPVESETPAASETRAASERPGEAASARNASAPARGDASASARTYTIQAGDTLEAVAIELYGDATYWDEIAQANPLVDPLRLRVGQVLRLPRAAELDATDDEQQVVAPGEVVRYTVRPGDTLSTIARQYYGKATRWRFLYNANRRTIGSNPDTLQAGDVLEIPPFPEPAR